MLLIRNVVQSISGWLVLFVAGASSVLKTRTALQLLRGALGDIDLDDPVYYGRLQRRRGHRTGHADGGS